MQGDPSTVDAFKAGAPFIVPFVSAVVDTWLKPKLVDLRQSLALGRQIVEDAIESKFQEYLARAYESHRSLTVLAFQNRSRKLLDIYIPLTLVEDQRAGSAPADDRAVLLPVPYHEGTKIDRYVKEFMAANPRALIADAAGMGKSTIMKFLFLSCITENSSIPVFVELRKLSKQTSVLDFIFNELNPLNEEFDREFILKLIRRGDFVFFLDGLDEIPFDDQVLVTKDLSDFISKAGDNYFVMTSRPDSSLLSFPTFHRFSIRRLEEQEAFTLLRKYDEGNGLAEQIIGELRRPALRSIHGFLENPFLVSLLYKAYEYKANIPLKKHIFYRQVYDALFESHDLTKGPGYKREKLTRLDCEDFHRVLRVFAFLSTKRGKVEYSKDGIIELLGEARTLCPGLSFKEGDFLHDILITVPLFNRDGNYFMWTHKSIQEYFAAQFICVDAKKDQAEILRRMAAEEVLLKYLNVLDLCYDIDYKTFRTTALRDLVEKFLAYCRRSHAYIDPTEIGEWRIQRRKELTFACKSVIGPAFASSGSSSERQVSRDVQSHHRHLFAHRCRGYESDATTWLYEPVPHAAASEGSPVGAIIGAITTFSSPLQSLIDTLAAKGEGVAVYDGDPLSLAVNWLPDAPVFIDDDPDSPVNTKETFSEINEALAFAVGCRLDTDACYGLMAVTDQELEREDSQQNPLLSGF
jgi:hypothetical protein